LLPRGRSRDFSSFQVFKMCRWNGHFPAGATQNALKNGPVSGAVHEGFSRSIKVVAGDKIYSRTYLNGVEKVRLICDGQPALFADFRRTDRGSATSGLVRSEPIGRLCREKLVCGLILTEAKSREKVSAYKSAAKLPNMTNLEAQAFNDSARYALMLAEQLQEQAVRDNLLKLVRVWLAAARDAEQANTYVDGESGRRASRRENQCHGQVDELSG
jgi:hypothetical protein